jgi:serine/threonine protein kinase
VTELQIHSKLSHPNIVGFHRAFSFQTSTYVVLELCSNGSLADMLRKRRYLTLPEIRRLVIQVCGAVKYLHHRHIVHRDLKTGNLFLDSNMNVKVGDFGLAALVVTEREMEVRRRTTMCGTPNYLAPEILEKGKGHDEKVDLWAIGVIAYTLAVGKAPFHASTKEEIYKKLRSGEYTWPELNSTSNQSADLRNLVSSLLVPEEQRPLPDQIVSHPFFKIAFVPSKIPSSAREKAPIWTDAVLPSVETLRRGFSETWYYLCKESGVGEYEEGKFFPLNGGRKVRSIVHDMAREVQAGRQPTMPIPKDVVYTSLLSDWDQVPGDANKGLREMSHNEVATTRSHILNREMIMKSNDSMPPPPVPRVVGRTGRAGSVRKVARTISEETAAQNSATIRIAPEATSSTDSLQIARTRPTASTTSSLRQVPSSSAPYQTAQPLPSMSEPITEKPQRVPSIKRSADASLARRPGTTRALRDQQPAAIKPVPSSTVATAPRRTARERPLSPLETAEPLASLEELAKVSPFKYKRKAQAAKEVVEILSDPDSEDNKQKPAATFLAKSIPSHQRKCSQLARSSDPAALPYTDPATVLRRLAAFRDNLAAELSKSSSSRSAVTAERRPPVDTELPFVSRWVDYSRKHGVGYVLSNGTVGCIINATAKPGQPATPVTHVLVRNGQKWLQKLGAAKAGGSSSNFAGIDSVPLEIFEDHSAVPSAGGILRKIYKGVGAVQSGHPLALDADRRRTLSVLWVKFGRYMCQSLEGLGEDSDSKQKATSASAAPQEEIFVRFYQRISSIGLWAFSDGCLQVHFPDHTKLVLSADGRAVSATLLGVEAAAHLARNGELLPQHVTSREVHVGEIRELLMADASAAGGRAKARIVRVNQLREKLAFVGEVVSQWVANGGLGRLSDDGEEQDGAERKLIWDGLAVKTPARAAVERVTVGRLGGDL